MHACMHACMRVCMYVCMHACVCVHTHTHTHTHIVSMCARTYGVFLLGHLRHGTSKRQHQRPRTRMHANDTLRHGTLLPRRRKLHTCTCRRARSFVTFISLSAATAERTLASKLSAPVFPALFVAPPMPPAATAPDPSTFTFLPAPPTWISVPAGRFPRATTAPVPAPAPPRSPGAVAAPAAADVADAGMRILGKISFGLPFWGLAAASSAFFFACASPPRHPIRN